MIFDVFTFGQMLIMLIVALTIISSVILAIVFKGSFSLKRRDGSGLSINKKKKDSLRDKIIIQKRDLLIIMGKISEITTEQVKIIELDSLCRQTEYANSKIGELRTIFESEFLEILKQKIKEKSTMIYDEDYKSYSIVIKGALNEILNLFIKSCIYENFFDISEDYFFHFVKRASDCYLKVITDAITEDFYIKKNISPEEIIEINIKEAYPKAKEIFISFFSNARRIYNENSERVEELDKVLIDFITNYLNIQITKEERFTFIKDID